VIILRYLLIVLDAIEDKNLIKDSAISELKHLKEILSRKLNLDQIEYSGQYFLKIPFLHWILNHFRNHHLSLGLN